MYFTLETERDRSPEVERSRRDRSASREKWAEPREPRESRRDAKGRERESEQFSLVFFAYN